MTYNSVWQIMPNGKLRVAWSISLLAQDALHWVTAGGKYEHEGSAHFLIDDDTGTIQSRPFVGVPMESLGEYTKQKRQTIKTRKARQAARLASRQSKQIDLKNPEKLDVKNVLQNRNRGTQASIMQMQSISKNPDYDRLGCTKDFGSGAPVVAYGNIPDKQKGKITEAVMPDGQRYTVQYAVVDANKILTSNRVDGSENADYFSDDSSKIRAIAGNGRVAGITSAYKQGNADNYLDSMVEDTNHGINADVINNMDSPVLVRIMQPKDVTSDIGDRSNRQTGLTLSPVEQANTDAGRVNLSKLETYEDGTPTIKSIKEFVSKMPPNEQGEMLDSDGYPSKRAADRLEAAVFAAAYQNDALTRLHVQALDPEAKNFIKGLSGAATSVAGLQNLGSNYDVRDIISNATIRAVNAIKSGQKLEDVADQIEMWKNKEDDEAERAVLRMLVKNKRSPKAITEKLQKMTKYLSNEAEANSGGLFGGGLFGGEDLSTPRNEIIEMALAQDSKRKLNARAEKLYKKYGGIVFDWAFNDGEYPRKFFKVLNNGRKHRKQKS